MPEGQNSIAWMVIAFSIAVFPTYIAEQCQQSAKLQNTLDED